LPPIDPIRNLFDDLPNAASEEVVDVLLDAANVRIERIVSTGQPSPPGFWYDQERPEWVVLLRGSGRLSFESTGEERTLQPGDFVHLPAHARHRVEWTDPHEPTVWLAVHYDE
jgi:cupin 2 domain-containing protein